jgi:hypothetical protein
VPAAERQSGGVGGGPTEEPARRGAGGGARPAESRETGRGRASSDGRGGRLPSARPIDVLSSSELGLFSLSVQLC